MSNAAKIKKPHYEILGSMEEADYRAMEGLSQSELSWMKKSPGHYAKRKDLQKETEAMKFGTIFHMALLEPQRFKDSYLIEPEEIRINGDLVKVNRKIKAHREYLEGWKLDNAERVILTPKQADNLTGMIREIGKDADLKELIMLGEPEVVSTWEYRGRKCKGKADILVEHPLHGRVVVDFKKTQDASHSGFSRSIYNYCYDLQAAWYKYGFGADKVFLIPVEESAPHAFGKWDAEPWLERGQRLADKLLDKLEWCEQNNQWPWYSRGFELILPPAWVPALENEEDI